MDGRQRERAQGENAGCGRAGSGTKTGRETGHQTGRRQAQTGAETQTGRRRDADVDEGRRGWVQMLSRVCRGAAGWIMRGSREEERGQ